MLTQKISNQLLSYNKKTGFLRWKAISCHKNHTTKIGSIAGSNHGDGYLKIMINGHRYLSHRLIWFMVTGRWPKNQIDHKNGIKNDNRWANLREATNGQNIANTGAKSILGVKGAYWCENNKKWRSSIRKNGITKHLGYFTTSTEANKAFATAASLLHGEFARTE